jgi:hypothetical protein
MREPTLEKLNSPHQQPLMKRLPTTLHRIAYSLQIEVGCAARILLRGKAPSVWAGRNNGKVRELLSFATPRLLKQAEYINKQRIA